MERGRGKSIVLNTRELREIARDAHNRGLNQQMSPAQFKLLDPKGKHVITPQFFHDLADGEPVERHIRCTSHIKLIGKDAAIEKMLDVSENFIIEHITKEEQVDMAVRSELMNTVGGIADDAAEKGEFSIHLDEHGEPHYYMTPEQAAAAEAKRAEGKA